MDDYEKLLDRAMERMPKTSDSEERFRMPRSSILPSGAKTIITNFSEIAQAFRREPEHVEKFLLKELATSGESDSGRLTVQGRFRSDVIDRKIEQYAKEYVMCEECGKLDTKIVREDRFLFLKCEACGSKRVVKRV